MPARIAEQDVYQALDRMAVRISRLEQIAKERVLPPLYVFDTDGSGNIVVVRQSDGATGTIVLT